jgi:hypothetical protein
MEEIIDFDSWLQQYTAPQVEYWAIFEPTTGEVTGIYPDLAAYDKQYKIKIDRDLAEDIHSGIIQMSSCFVDIDSETVEIITKHSLVKIDDVLHRVIDKKYVPDQKNDIIIQYNELENKIIFVLHNSIKTRKIQWAGSTEMQFFITGYNDPHDLYQTIVFQLKDLEQSSKEFIYTGSHNQFSIFTRRILKNYVFEKI